MSKVDRRKFRLGEGCRVAGVLPGTVKQWRNRYGFLGGPKDNGQRLLSVTDVAVLTMMGTLTRRGFNAPDAAKWSEKVRPILARALDDYLRLGRWPDTAKLRVTLEQEPVNGLPPILPVTFDVGQMVEWVVEQLGLPVPQPSPTAQEAKTILTYIASDKFAERLAALNAEIDERTPRVWNWSDLERVCGVPEWFCAWALEQPRHQARKELERVLSTLPETTQ